MIHLNAIELELKKRFDAGFGYVPGAEEPNAGFEIARNTKRIIGQFGHDLGYHACASGFETFEQGWRFDIDWYKDEMMGANLTHANKEFKLNTNLKRVKTDFEKLLIVEPRLKILISNSYMEKNVAIHAYCENMTSNYTVLAMGSPALVLIREKEDPGKFIPQLIIK